MLFGTTLLGQNPHTSFDQFLGVNWQNPEKFEDLDCVGFIRDFHAWEYSQNADSAIYPNQSLNFNPTNVFPLNLDYVYGQFYDKGIDISPTMMYSIEPYAGEKQNIRRLPISWEEVDTEEGRRWTPVEPRDAPDSFLERADWIFHFLSRYAPPENLNDTISFKYSRNEIYDEGQGYVRYVESWNEPDNIYWHPRLDDTTEVNGGAFSPEEYAAMASMDYDAHERTVLSYMDSTEMTSYYAGVKNLSEDIKFVMGAPYTMDYDIRPSEYYKGLEPCHPEYDTCGSVLEYWIKPMYDWFRANRADQQFIFDVINLHNYSLSTPNSFSPNAYWISPERDAIRKRLEEDVLAYMEEQGWREDNENYKELWLSEFGYDTNEEAWENVYDTTDAVTIVDNDYRFNYSSFTQSASIPTAEDIQAQWVARTFLELAAAGVDRAMVHHAIDNGHKADDPWDKYTGLRTNTNKPKKVWFYIYGMKNILNGFRFVEDESTNCNISPSDADCTTSCIRKYRFENEAGDRIWAIWSPTECGKSEEVLVNIAGVEVTENWSVLRLGEPSIYGIQESFSVDNGNALLEVSETPLFLLEKGQGEPPVCMGLSVEEVYCSGARIVLDKPILEKYENISVWYGEYEEGFTPDFSANTGNLEEFENHGLNQSNSLIINGLEPGVRYIAYIIPRNKNGIADFLAINPATNLSYCSIDFTTSGVNDYCKLPIGNTDFARITSLNDNGVYEAVRAADIALFDNQDIDFCQTSDLEYLNIADLDSAYFDVPLDTMIVCEGVARDTFRSLTYIWDSWINYHREESVIIEFSQPHYIHQFYLFDGSSAGLLTFEWSDDQITWNPLSEYYTNGGKFIQLYEDGDDLDYLDCTYDHYTFGEWASITEIDNPMQGVKYLKITATNSDARVAELFICGEEVEICPNIEIETLAECTAFNLKLGTDCAMPTTGMNLEYQGSQSLESIAITSRRGRYPLEDTFEKQLIPGVNYLETAVVHSSNGDAVSHPISLTTLSDCNNILTAASYPPLEVDSFKVLGCPKNTFQTPDLPLGTQLELWTSSENVFHTDKHPMQSGAREVKYNLSSVYQHEFLGKCVDIEQYDYCGDSIYVVYRYITENQSSPLYKFSYSRKHNNLMNALNYEICSAELCSDTTQSTDLTYVPQEGNGNIFFIYNHCGWKGIYFNEFGGVNTVKVKEWTAGDEWNQRNLLAQNELFFSDAFYFECAYPSIVDKVDIEVEGLGNFSINDLLATYQCEIGNHDDGDDNDNDGDNDGDDNDGEGDGEEEENSSQNEEKIYLFPNPVEDYLNLICGTCVDYEISDVHGKIYPLRDTTTVNNRLIISIDHLDNGMYFIQGIKEKAKRVYAKFVVQHED